MTHVSWSSLRIRERSCLGTITWVLVPLHRLIIPSSSRDSLSHSCRRSYVSPNWCFLSAAGGHWPCWIKSLTWWTTWSVACACLRSILGPVDSSPLNGSVDRTVGSPVRADTQFTCPQSWDFAENTMAWRTSCVTISVQAVLRRHLSRHQHWLFLGDSV